MDIFTEKLTLKAHISKLKSQNKTIGFIPTMGALHRGHLSLIKKAQKKNDTIQAHGGAGVHSDLPLAGFYAYARSSSLPSPLKTRNITIITKTATEIENE